MILPTKHVSAEHSLLGVGALVLSRLGRPRTVSALWEDVRPNSQVATFERFSLALDLLYAIGAVDFLDGLLQRTTQ